MSDSRRGLTRRQAAACLGTAASAALAQDVAKTQDDIAASRERMRRQAEKIRKVAVPVATDPSFIFRA